MIKIERLATLDQLTPYRTTWDEFARDKTLASSAWLWSWWSAYSDNRELFVLRIHDGEETLGFAPWYREFTRSGATAIKSLGDGKACTDYQTILTSPSYESAVAEALADWLVDHCDQEPMQWDRLEIEAAADRDLVTERVIARLEERGAQVAKKEAACSWGFEFDDNWDDYLQRVKKGIRQKLRKLDRIYAGTGRSRLVELRDDEDCGPWLERLVVLHQARWNSVGIEGCFATQEFENFLRNAVAELHKQGRIWFVGLELDHEIVAVALYLRDGDAIRLYQVGVDPERRADQIGWQLNHGVLKTAFERGVKHVDFLRGEEDYKRYLGGRPIDQSCFRVAAPKSSSKLRHTLWMTSDMIRDWGRQISGH